jgi:WD40 repeat protein
MCFTFAMRLPQMRCYNVGTNGCGALRIVKIVPLAHKNQRRERVSSTEEEPTMERRPSTIIITITVGLAVFLTSCGSPETSPAISSLTSPPPSTSTSVQPAPTSAPTEVVEPTVLSTATAEPITFIPAGLSVIAPDNAARLIRFANLTGLGASVVAFSPDGRLLASGTFGEGAIIVWDLTTGEAIHTLKGHVDPRVLNYLAFSPDGRTLISGAQGWDDLNNSMILWDVVSGEQVRTFDGGPGALTRDWRTLAISTTGGFEEDTLTFFNMETSEEMGTIETDNEILGVSFSHDDKLLATRLRETWSSPIIFWGVKNLREVRWLYDWQFFTFSPGGSTVAAIIDDEGDRDKGELKIFNMDEFLDNHTLATGADAIWYMPPTFSPDERLLVASFDRFLRVWETRSWEEIAVLMIPQRSGTVFSPDGRILVVFSHDYAVQLWGVLP